MFNADSAKNVWYMGKVNLILKEDGTYKGKDVNGNTQNGIWSMPNSHTIIVDRDTNQVINISNNHLSTLGQIRYKNGEIGIIGTLITEFQSTGTPLPVTYLNFKAQYQNSHVLVSWATVTEQNNGYFDIERSADAISFTPVGRLNGKGLSDSRQDYAYVDETPLSGWNYYRLKQVDTDGTVAFSRPVAVLNEGSLAGTSLVVFPNPVSNTLTVRVAGNVQVQTMRVSNMEGQWISTTNGTGVINTQSLSVGVYVVEVQTLDGKTLRQRFIKE